MKSTQWKTLPLGQALTFQRGFDITKDEQRDGPYSVFSSSGPKSTHSESKVRGPGVIIGRKGTLGTVFYSEEDFWPHDTTLWVKDFHGNNPKFAYYFLQTMGFERLDAGASNPTLNRNHIHTIPVQWPALGVQRRIVTILSVYDGLIENNLRRINILEEMARVLYREWFVEFKFPGHEKVTLVSSAIGPVPRGWTISTVEKVADVFRGRSYGSADLADEGGLPFVNLKCMVRDGGFRRSGLKRYTGDYKDTHRVRKGDIVMGVTDMTQERRIVARAALVPTLDKEYGVFSMDLVRIEPKSPLPKSFLYAFFRFSHFADEVKQHANGANVLHLSPDRISAFRFVIPPQNLMLRFADVFGPTLEQVDSLENQNEILRETRDLLLPRLLSGPVPIAEAAIVA